MRKDTHKPESKDKMGYSIRKANKNDLSKIAEIIK